MTACQPVDAAPNPSASGSAQPNTSAPAAPGPVSPAPSGSAPQPSAPAPVAPAGNELPIPAGGYVQGFFGTNLPEGESGGDPKHDGSGQWMQDFCNLVRVVPEGVQCTSKWDEAHHEHGIYDFKDGRFVKNGEGGWNNDQLTDSKGGAWKIEGLKYLGGTSVSGPGCTISGDQDFRPNGLGLANDGRIMVADNGRDQQVKLYDPATCELKAAVGDKGGVFGPGAPAGVTGPTRFYGLHGTGMTPDGDVVVGGNAPGTGAWLSRVTLDNKLVWRRYGFVFTSSPGFDPASNGTEAYGKGTHYKLDFSRPKNTDAGGGFPYAFNTNIFDHPEQRDLQVGFDGKWLNPTEAPAEARVGGAYVYDQGVMSVQRINGRLYKFHTGMNGPGMGARRFDGEMSYEMPLSLGERDESYWGWYADSQGSIWAVSEDLRKPIRRFRVKSTDDQGNLQYGTDAMDEYQVPADSGFTMLERVYYEPGTDTLFLSGYTKERDFIAGWGAAGTEVQRYDGWVSGDKKRTSKIPMQYTRVKGGSGAGGVTEFDPDKSITAENFTVAGKYVIVNYSTIGPKGKRGEHEVFDSETGTLVQTLGIDPEVRAGNEPTGWLDLRNPTHAVRRSNGECVLGAEDDFFNSYLYWRFACP